jgi:hypothetical protein
VQTSYSQGSSQLQVKAQAARQRHEVDESSDEPFTTLLTRDPDEHRMGEDTEDNAAEDKATDQEEDVDMEDDEGVSEADKR